ncbi:aminopeptidase O-like isoform X2 [Ylistrum balloti]|uniref:aminopeptidase O-like isoform X2 n=1 Tax=Ylistrum balloti TaxID=509963 RepID=UPI002905E544|nr:aminopeptidase O-like isoform X2 [Ylistrum balloti]
MSDKEDSCHEKDLPLMSNVKDILVYHYILDLKCHLEEKTISGSVVVFCKPTTSDISPSCDDSNADCKEMPVCNGETSQFSGNRQDLLVTASSSTSVPDSKISSESQISEKEICVFDRKRKSLPSDGLEDDALTRKVKRHGDTAHNNYNPDDKNVLQSTISKDFDEQQCNNELLSSQNRLPSVAFPTVSSDEVVSPQFQMILDCCDINILKVEDLTDCEEVLEQISDDPFNKIKRFGNNENVNENHLKFTVEKHCLRVFKTGCTSIKDYPKVMKISFLTKPEGQSLKWTNDQDGKPCVYTHGHWINNRSLFPSQDVPVSMATWQAVVSVEVPVSVVMSGDKEPVTSTTEDGWTHFYFNTQMVMPSSTISLAIGHWQVKSLITMDSLSEPECEKTIPCRLFCASSLMDAASQEIGRYMGSCLRAAYNTLGPHPFRRLDIVVVPSSFDSLGMASPSMLYLSQSLLVGDFSMCVRIAHEVSHSWFGLAIGPSDWTEEWLTEGFCTYTEDVIHNLAMQTVAGWTEEYGDHHREIRDVLRYRTLVAELEHTDEELQTLRPNKEDEEESYVTYVKNGMNPDKRFMQVHYLKGYFLLRYLERKAGRNVFLHLMKNYVQQFHGRLVSSQDVLTFFLGNCSEFREQHITEDALSRDWLDCPGIPKHLQNFQMDKDNVIATQVISEMDAIQMTLLMEELLHTDKLGRDVLSALGKVHNISTQNPEIQHRWCELVIKYKIRKHYEDIKNFLVHHQAMGVYLYGELIISRDKEQKALALGIFEQLRGDMEPDSLQSICAMLFG